MPAIGSVRKASEVLRKLLATQQSMAFEHGQHLDGVRGLPIDDPASGLSRAMNSSISVSCFQACSVQTTFMPERAPCDAFEGAS